MNYESLNHTEWECKYHVVFIPKYRRKTLYGELRRHLGQVFHELARQKECKVEEGHLMPDHVHMLLAHPTEVCGVAGARLHEGQKRDPHRAGVCRTKAQFRRRAFLGTRIPRVQSRQG